MIRSEATNKPLVGWAPVGGCAIPHTNSTEDIEAARFATVEMDTFNTWSTGMWTDPVFLGRYPKVIEEFWETCYQQPADGDMEIISQPIDFFGANIYNAPRVRAGANGKPEVVPDETGLGRTLFHWPVSPEALYWGPKFFHDRYQKPVVITENGMALSDWVHLDGKVHDPQRIDFLQRYLQEFERAGRDGVDIAGYMQWSFMDNFEWAEGYRFRFGLVHVDYTTQKRTPKDSAYWYKDVIATNGANIL